MKLLILKDLQKETGVYKITNIANQKIYIGSTSNSFYNRFHEHKFALINNIHTNEYLQRAFTKYGEENFIFELLEVCEKEKCIEREQYWIDILVPFGKTGYNICKFAASSLGYKHTKKSIRKMKKFAKTKKINPKAIEAMKKANIGKKKPIHVINSLIEAISVPVIQLSMQGDYVKEWSNMTEAANYLEVSNNISSCVKNGRSVGGFLWVKKSEYNPKTKYSYKGRQGIANHKKVYQYDLDWNLIKEWECIQYAAKALGIHDMSIHQCLRNEDKRTCKGFKWSKNKI